LSALRVRWIAIASLAAVCAAAGCRSAPVTQRKQLVLVPEGHEMALGADSYREIIAQSPRSTNRQYIDMVNRVGKRIAQAADRPDYQWEFTVIASGEQNAFCLPGGKVAMYEGILPICGDEAGVAVVVSHEVAHALARHGSERMSQQMVANGVSMVVNHVTRKQEEYNRQLIRQAYGVVSEYGAILPFSRKHELEADHIGLILMAKAGYDPSAAPRFWDRFAAVSQGSETPEFLSTHPTDQRRSDELRKALPEAMDLYASAAEKLGFGEAIAALPAGAPPQRMGGHRAASQPAAFAAPAESVR
jgi:predicted Zn-dependent protease